MDREKMNANRRAAYRLKHPKKPKKKVDKVKRLEYHRKYWKEQKMTELMRVMTQLAEDMTKLGETKHISLMREQFFAATTPEEAQNLLKAWGAPVRKYRHVNKNKPSQEW